MKLDPLPAKRLQVEEIINKQFPWQFNQRDMAYVQKRILAKEIIAGFAPSQDFTRAAEVEGMDTTTFANLILSKPDIAMQKENERRERVLRARNAKTTDELKAILTELNWTGEF